ncbi:response regulator receiver protein [gamma proteobacterium HTCC5015]|nr:response regulator receiver protein [gamma proteobacterium HTCC5015]
MQRVLLVEDNADNRDLIEAMIGDRFELSMASDGGEALGLLADRERFDVLLLDISLPEMDGVELLQKIRTLPDYHQVPAVALTSHAMKGDRERFLAKGFDGYVSKPIIDERDLLNVMDSLLN